MLKYLTIVIWMLAVLGHAADGVVRLAAVGDVMVARTVPARLAAHAPAWPWNALDPLWRQADLRFCNLECAVTAAGTPIPKRYSFRADPELARSVLQPFDIVSVANNHSYDYGRDGLANTLANLRAFGIAAAGAGAGRAGAVAPVLLTRKGLRLAFVAYTCWTPDQYLPTEDGIALATYDEATFARELVAAKAGADLLIVSLHWGKEYAAGYAPEQQKIAHQAIDAGADLVLGHHPHVAQAVEIYHDRPICYSLGNCLFDRSGDHHSNGLLVRTRLEKGKVTVEQTHTFAIEDSRPIMK